MGAVAGRAMGVTFDRLEAGLEVAPASKDLEIKVGTVPKGTVAGDLYWVDGYVGGERFLRVEVYWLVEPGVIGWPAPADRYQWTIEIEGRPSARMVLDAVPSLDGSKEPYDPGFHATMAAAINAIDAIVAAPPGIFQQPVFAPWRADATDD